MLSCIFVVGVTLILSMLLPQHRKRELAFFKRGIFQYSFALIAVVPIFLFATIWVIFPNPNRFDNDVGEALIGTFVFTAAIGFGEEFLYRGPLWDICQKIFKLPWLVGIISTVGFVWSHPPAGGEPLYVPFLIAGGLLFSSVRIYFNSFAACALLHMLWNFLWFLTTGLPIRPSGLGGYAAWTAGLRSQHLYLLAIACVAVSVAVLCWRTLRIKAVITPQ
jgi:membrane protease YdiL (CAAX protease family)